MKVAIVGSRKFPFPEMVAAYVRTLHESVVIVSGGATGVDHTAEVTARERGLKVEIIVPDYQTWGPKKAPLVRNHKIASECDLLVAFWDGYSGGTANAVTWAAVCGKEIKVFMS